MTSALRDLMAWRMVGMASKGERVMVGGVCAGCGGSFTTNHIAVREAVSGINVSVIQ